MAQKIVVLKGSPRRHGNSAVLADQAIKGALENGAEVEQFVLDGMKMRPCSACDECRKSVPSGAPGSIPQCAIQDDMQKIYPKLVGADAIIIASPVYFFNMSAQMKICIDRWYALRGSEGYLLKNKKIGILLTFGDTNVQSSGAINAIHSFQDIFGYLDCKIMGIVYGSADAPGEIASQKEVMEQAFELGKKLAV